MLARWCLAAGRALRGPQLALLLPAAACAPLGEPPPETVERPPNVLLICVDDLRPELGCAGSPRVSTPHIDSLANQGRVFTRHYAVVPTCGASRAALLTGRRPRLPVELGNGALSALRAEPRPTLPGIFRGAGYRTVALGKVSHSHDGRLADGSPEVPGAWDELPTDPGPWGEASALLHAYAGGVHRRPGISPLWQFEDVEDEGYPDGLLAAQAVAQLEELAAGQQPFFLAVGFFKPHLPFCAPRRYLELYDPESIDPGPEEGAPLGLGPVHAHRQSGEVTGNYACPQWADRAWDAGERREMIHAYLACVSYVDAQIGKVLAALDGLGLSESTLVVLWGDHGWHLGEQGLMGKHTTFESALASALILRVPADANPGEVSTRLISSLDLFPTLCALADLPVPAELDGQGFADEFGDLPDRGRVGAPSFWRRGKVWAATWRTERWRLVRWYDPAEDRTECIELYDLELDPRERRNVADERPQVVEQLLEQLAAAAPRPGSG